MSDTKNNISQPYKDNYSYDNTKCKYNIDNFYSFSNNNKQDFGNILKYNTISSLNNKKEESFSMLENNEDKDFDFSDEDDDNSGYSELFSSSDDDDEDDDDEVEPNELDQDDDDDDELQDDDSNIYYSSDDNEDFSDSDEDFENFEDIDEDTEDEDTEPKNKSVVVYESKDVIYQKWNNIVINYNEGYIDIFLNGVLVGSYVGVAPYMKLDEIVTGSENGIYGGVCNLVYYNDVLNEKNIVMNYKTLRVKEMPYVWSINDDISFDIEKNKNPNNTFINNMKMMMGVQ